MRYLSIDIMRGLTVIAMILVNTPGSWDYVYAPLSHASWHGYTPTDLIFPFFLFIVGSAMCLSMSRDTGSKVLRLKKLWSRGAKIFAIGLALHFYASGFDFSSLRIMGVLQRIGLAYVLAGSLIICLDHRRAALMSIIILLAYSLMLLGSDDPYSLSGNVVAELDRYILGAAHMWQKDGVAFDPEGLLSTLPVIATIIIGYKTTYYLSVSSDRLRAVMVLLASALVMLVMGYVVASSVPINKNLWTPSYVLISGAWAIAVLAVFVLLVDVLGLQRWGRPLLWFGANPMALYVISWAWTVTYYKFSIAGQPFYDYLYACFNAMIADPYLASLLFAMAHIALFGVLARWLYRRGIFIKI
ncbi:putative acyltransferase [Sinobacterium caligoides]|uniref:Putative acyltransferase n=1 Tax=Sinobacterium caligoides TaxID=933926 RepID=A0A3N2DNN8_9GAMM|nr:heparan-alpha-glucosaminide N-acetyltransferase domain-containing protein [Sinobacterium caligoides]ROS01428.1 putative acyltransferase [Sinobacterium caligoides]